MGNNQKATERRAIHAYLSDEAFEAWDMLAEETGVPLTALLEAMGLILDRELSEVGVHPRHQEMVRMAKKIAAKRRRRGKNAETRNRRDTTGIRLRALPNTQ